MNSLTGAINSQKKISKSKIFISFIIAIIFSLFSLNGLSLYNPLWVVLLIIYWHIRFDIKNINVNLNYAFILGVVCDLVNGNILGISSISYLIISLLLSIFKPKIYFYTMLQILILVTSLLFINQIIFLSYYLVLGIGNNITLMHFFAPIVSSLIVWPIFQLISDRLLLNSN